MTDNLIGFKKSTQQPFAEVAWNNYHTFRDIIISNIAALDDPDSAWMILGHSPFEFKGDSELLGFSCGFVRGWLTTILRDLEDPIVKESYIGSELEMCLDAAMQFMDADLFTRITMRTDDIANTIILVRTYELWGVTNIFTNGVSVWEALRNALFSKGYTFNQLF